MISRTSQSWPDGVAIELEEVTHRPLYLVNETWVYKTKKEAIRQARNLANVVFMVNQRHMPKRQAKEESSILVRPITAEEAKAYRRN
jgi:hypothetical protein